MARDELPELVRLQIYANEHRLYERSPEGHAVARILRAGIDDAYSAEWLRSHVFKHRIAQAFAGPFDLPPPTGGDLVMGVDLKGAPVRAPVQHLNAHGSTIGASGSGKTNKCYFTAMGVAPHVQGVWLIDLRKSEFARLRGPMRRLGIELLRLPARAMRFNPLQVPLNVEPPAWAAALADALVQVLRLQQRSSKLLHSAILRLYERLRIEHAPRRVDPGIRYPTLFDLRETTAAWKDAHPQARSAITDALDPILLSLGSDVLGYAFGWTTHDLSRLHIIFELSGSTRAEQDLILNSLLLAEFMSRVAGGVSNPVMNLFIGIDEASRLCSASDPSAVISDMLGLVRGTGIGIDLSFQSSHDIHPSVFSNTSMKHIGRVGSATDLDAFGSAMGLSMEQRRWALQHLQPGTFVTQLGEGSSRAPFVLRVPLLRLSERADHGTPDLDALRALPCRSSAGEGSASS
ncbi:MAG: ATP-binding protein [Phycisphaerales bacterium]|nr:ATP-binding protein [Phycisphaerales bacterium]